MKNRPKKLTKPFQNFYFFKKKIMECVDSPKYSITQIHSQIETSKSNLDFETAIFWALFLFEINENLENLFILLQLLNLNNEHKRCINYRRKAEKLSDNELATNILPLKIRLIFGNCYFKLENFDEAVEIISQTDQSEIEKLQENQEQNIDQQNNLQENYTGSNKENILVDNVSEDQATGLAESENYEMPDILKKDKDDSTAGINCANAKNAQQNSTKDGNLSKLINGNKSNSVFTINSSNLSCKYLLLSDLYDNLQNPVEAERNALIAIEYNPLCAGAWEKIKRRRYLSQQNQSIAENQWLSILDSIEVTAASNANTKIPFSEKTSVAIQNSTIKKPITPKPIHKTSCYITKKAHSLYSQHKIHEAYELTSSIIKNNTFNWAILPLHLTILVELASNHQDHAKKNEIHKISHQLMDHAPKNSISWFSVGCYYYSINQMKAARQNFARATEFPQDKFLCLESWIAFGHAFAKDFEHDQALAAYIHASEMMPNAYEPNLYIGMQHLSNKNYKMAEEYFLVAKEQSCHQVEESSDDNLPDPFILSELGIIRYTQENYTEAETFYEQALISTQNTPLTQQTSPWVSIFLNYASCLRKLKKYDAALIFYDKARILDPNYIEEIQINIGLIYLYQEKYGKAIESLEAAIAINPRNEVSRTLLQDAMELWCVDMNVEKDDLLDSKLEFQGSSLEEIENLKLGGGLVFF